MGNIKKINIKNGTYPFFDDMINIKNFDSNLLKIDYIGYVTKEDSKYLSIDSVNPLYFIVDEVDGFSEEKEWSKYLNFSSTDNRKEVLKKYIELWDKIKNLIEKIHNKPGEYGKDYMKLKFNSDDNLPLSKPLKFRNLIVIAISVFQEISKYYP